MRAVLDEVVVRERIGAVIVATEPSMHVPYVLWALERGVSVLLDKPLSVHAGASVNPTAAAAIAEDYDKSQALFVHYVRICLNVTRTATPRGDADGEAPPPRRGTCLTFVPGYCPAPDLR